MRARHVGAGPLSQERPVHPTIGEVAGRVGKHVLQLVGLGHQQADVLVVPLGRRHVLDEEQDALEVLLLLQIGLPADEEGGADIEVELAESVPLCQVGVPEADCGAQRQLAQQEVVHPAEGELEVLDLVVDNVVVERQVNTLHQLLQLPDLHLNMEVTN